MIWQREWKNATQVNILCNSSIFHYGEWVLGDIEKSQDDINHIILYRFICLETTNRYIYRSKRDFIDLLLPQIH